MKIRIGLIIILAMIACAPSADAQRRSRPGAMKHTQAEVTNKQKITKLNCRYIKDGSVFEGPIYMTGDAGGIKIGDAVIAFYGGKFMLSFEAAKFNVKKYAYMTPEERHRRGISEYEYRNAWEHKKLGEDFDYEGRYSTIEQYGQKWLILYNGDTDNVYAKIPLNSINDQSFELDEDDMLVKMSYVQ